MKKVGIEAMNLYPGRAKLDVHDLFVGRGLNLSHFENLLMYERSVHLPWEDPVTNAVNAAKPIIDAMSEEDKNRIELVITSSESGVDFGKSISTYVHRHLGLGNRCRLLEVKQACFGGTAALQLSINYIASQVSPGAKILIMSSDIARNSDKMSYAEPSLGTGAVAMLVGENPEVFEMEFGKNGLHAFEVGDTCRPQADIETGDPDLSLFSYIDCMEQCVSDYMSRCKVEDFVKEFDYLTFHTPFAGMVKGAFRHLMRKLYRLKPQESDAIFAEKIQPSIIFPQKVGNLYSASIYSALTSLLSNIKIADKKHVGMFSYGSGCSSEFYSGFITPKSVEKVLAMNIAERIEERYRLNMETFDKIFEENSKWFFGVQDGKIDFDLFPEIYKQKFEGTGALVLDHIKGYHREYRWS